MVKGRFIAFGTIKLNVYSRKLFIQKRAIVLRNKEFSLLEYFMKNTGVVVSRTQLLEEVWDRNICCSTNTVDVHVSSLRRKFIQNMGCSPIKTVYCVGYIFEI